MAALTTALRARTELASGVESLDPPGPLARGEIATDKGRTRDVLWVQDADQGNEVDIEVLTGAQPVTYDELVFLDVVIQVLEDGTDATQSSVDQRAEELYGEVVGTLAGNALLVDETNPDDPTVDGTEARITGFASPHGFLPDGSGFGTRIVVSIECSSRISLS